MRTLPTITIGIPAYNEQKTLPHLLSDISKQSRSGFRISSVIIVSDASTDQTAQVAKQQLDLPITVVTNSVRRGKAFALNYIMSHAKTDAVVILDADVRIPNTDTLKHMVKPIFDGGADLVAAAVYELTPHTIVERALAASMYMKRLMFEEYRRGHNIYTCHGRGRAFSRNLYRKIRFESSVNEDAFSYIYCIRSGYTYQYARQARLYYRLPTTLSDHVKQSVRFVHSKSDHDFQKDEAIKAEYAIAWQNVIAANIHTLFRKPYIILYYMILGYTTLLAHFAPRTKQGWETSDSSKITNI